MALVDGRRRAAVGGAQETRETIAPDRARVGG